LGEILAPILKEGAARDDGDDASMIVIEAASLGPRSALRRVVEAAPNAAALPCYGDEGRGLETVIRQTLAAKGLRAGPETVAYLGAHLGGDRLITRNEIAKLALYVGGEGEVRLADAMACIGDSSALGLDDLIDQAALGKRAELDRSLSRLYLEGTSPITVLRAASRHFQNLHYVSGMIAAGEPMDQAIRALRPPLFFKRKANFQAQLRHWPQKRLAAVLASLTGAEADCKTTGAPAGAICGRTLMRIAYDARRSGQPRPA
jgi:DNA polymerase-3 subunit delta